jgi:DNA-binding transcriptional LysR family regulator
MDEWEAWRTVLAVARAGSLGAAAAALRLDAGTVARRIRRLEATLGRRLFQRRGGGIEPTPACTELLPNLAEADTALRALGGGAPGEEGAAFRRTVRITAVSMLCDHLLAPALPGFVARHPFAVELIADARNLSLTRREADVALRLGPPAGSRAGARCVGALSYAVYARRDRVAADLPWAALDTTMAHLPEVRYVEREAGRAGVRYRSNRAEGVRAILDTGLARSVLPVFLGDADPALVRAGPPGVVERPLWLIVNPEDADAPHIRAAARWIGETCAAAAPVPSETGAAG